jgi:hypothetical protein
MCSIYTRLVSDFRRFCVDRRVPSSVRFLLLGSDMAADLEELVATADGGIVARRRASVAGLLERLAARG